VADPDEEFAITVLGRFEVVIDGRLVDPTCWRRKPAAALVKLLALAPERRMHREAVFDALWPDLSPADAAPRLHKAVHFVRRAIGPDGIATTGEALVLLPDRPVAVDVIAFEDAAATALDRGAGFDAALTQYAGELLPEDRYEDWAAVRRAHVEHLHRQLLRAAGRWTELLAADPTDEPAHVAVMRGHLDRGNRAAALAQYDRLAAVLHDELDAEPGEEAEAARALALALPANATDEPLPMQEIRFCHARDGVRLAYTVVGDGRPLVKSANWLSHLEYDWESATWRHWLHDLTRRFRMLRYDARGGGLSDWNTDRFDLEAWVDDLEVVVEAAGYERFPMLGISQGAAVAVEYAARHPDKVSALVLYGGFVHGPLLRAGTDDDRRRAALWPEMAELGWGQDEPSFRQVFTARFMPGGTKEQWSEFNELQARSTSPANAAEFMRGVAVIDVTDAAPLVRCPTLVVHVRGDRHPPVSEGRLLASMIPGSRFVSLEGDNHIMLADEPAWPRFLAEVDRFLADVT
jgi:DNA-binding SARP family transcriptional activator/pimeloyl-ACP methyl ester carboxylesterase